MSKVTFGIDLGIGSCGWAVLRHPATDETAGEIVALGSWIFDVPETDKERTPTNQIRRGNRLLRRVIRRRRNRMAELRRLFEAERLLGSSDPDALKQPDVDPWELRARGLDKVLTPKELAIALGHIAKRRGFKSAAKRKTANVAGDDQKMLKALEGTKELLGRYRTVGEMFVRDPAYADRKRNRDGVYDRTASRHDLAHEVQVLFREQRRLGNAAASEKLEDAYTVIAFRQKPMQDSERLVGLCPFEPAEKRSARMAPSFELFRLLTRLVHLRVTDGETERSLTPAELTLATADLGKTATLTGKKVRNLIGLPDEQRFTTIKTEQEKGDIASRTGDAMAGTAALRKGLGDDMWGRTSAEQRDRIAHILTFFETNEGIGEQLRGIGLDGDALAALIHALDAGAFAKFKGAAHISAKAARALIPHLEQGRRYDQACAAAGYNHAASSLSHVEQVIDKASFKELVAEVGESVANPIARKAMTEGLKQLWAMRNKWGLPDAIHIELAREVGNSLEKRNEIKKRLDETTAQRDRERQEAADQLGIQKSDVNGDILLRYRLWKEQGGFCLYTGKPIGPGDFMSSEFQVDHILPWSRFNDDSYHNKTLCVAGANQRKKRATPCEWFAMDKAPEDWELFVTRVETSKLLRGYKKRNYLLKNAAEQEDKFRTRNLNDTRYAARLLAEAVKLFYPRGERQEKEGKRRVFTRPGALTSALRKAWGLESLKKIDGKRVSDDRHHALDALVVAAVGEDEVQRLTRSFQEWEQQGLGRPLREVEEPWEGFRNRVRDALADVIVARPERRRARGEGHAATIRQVVERDGHAQVYERKAVIALKEGDLDRIKDPERNRAIIEAIRAWMAAGRPNDQLPTSPRGDVITKVRLLNKGKVSVRVRGGTADRGEIVRVDVFVKPNKRGKEEFYLVPIYPHQVMDKKQWPTPPMCSIVAYKDEVDWTPIDGSFGFRFSLYPRSYVEVTKSNGEIKEGYFCGTDRSTGALSLFAHGDTQTTHRSIGAKTLLTMKKYSVDRFGNMAEVKSEVRTWHGEVCTSPSPPG